MSNGSQGGLLRPRHVPQSILRWNDTSGPASSVVWWVVACVPQPGLGLIVGRRVIRDCTPSPFLRDFSFSCDPSTFSQNFDYDLVLFSQGFGLHLARLLSDSNWQSALGEWGRRIESVLKFLSCSVRSVFNSRCAVIKDLQKTSCEKIVIGTGDCGECLTKRGAYNPPPLKDENAPASALLSMLSAIPDTLIRRKTLQASDACWARRGACSKCSLRRTSSWIQGVPFA